MPANNLQLIKLHYVCRIDTVVYVYVEQEHKVILTKLTGRKPCTSRCYFLYPKCTKIYLKQSRISKFFWGRRRTTGPPFFQGGKGREGGEGRFPSVAAALRPVDS